MSRRKNNTTNLDDGHGPTEIKKPKISNDVEILPFTSNEFLKNVIIGDKFISIVGFVDNISAVKKFKSKDERELTLFKFIVNNNTGSKISCFAWNEDVTKFVEDIHLNHIILIENATARNESKFNDGNMAFELLLKKYTEIKDFGLMNLEEEITEIKNGFDEIAETHGFIKCNGYIRDKFINVNQNRETEYLGSISDGIFKLEILLTNSKDTIACCQGQQIQVIGRIQEHENSVIYIEVNDRDKINIVDGPRMKLSKLLEVQCLKRKK